MAAEDIDIFEEETRQMIKDQQVPFETPVTPMDERAMFSMPSENIQSSQSYGEGSGDRISIQGTPGVDQVFTQIIFSPTFRAIARVEDLPPETVGEAKRIFEYLVKTEGVNNAAEYLLRQFGEVKQNPQTFPIMESIGPDPRRQIVSGVDQYSSAGFEQGIGSLPQ